MQQIFNYLSDNTVTSFIAVGTVIVGILGWLYNSWRDHRDRDAIRTFMRSALANEGVQFSSTHFMASKLHLPDARVKKLCETDKRVRRNEKDRESWSLSNR